MITRKTFHYISFHFLLLFVSCSKMPIYTSEYIQKNTTNDFPSFKKEVYDKKNQLSYAVANTDSNIYLRVIFHEHQNLMKIVRGGGLNVYFDPTIKKKKKYHLKIGRTPGQVINHEPGSGDQIAGRLNRFKNMSDLIDSSFTRLSWKTPHNEWVYNRKLQKKPIRADISPNLLNELVLLVKTPKTEFDFPEEKKKLCLGIVSEATVSEANKRAMRTMRPAGGIEGRPAGARAGRGGGGGRPAGRRPGAGNGPQKSGSPSPLEFWFTVEITE